MRQCAALLLLATVTARGPVAAPPADVGLAHPQIHIEDVALFYKVYDAADGHPSAARLQHDYLDHGSPGLKQLARLRNVTGERIAQNLAAHPDVYANARRCMAVLPQVRRRLVTALRKLQQLYPPARAAPITIAVGRGKPVGVTGADGVQIGLEALCAADEMTSNIEDRFVNVIAHEYGHVEQLRAIADDEHPTVLEAALVEGGAELCAELISGQVANPKLFAQVTGRELEIESAFEPDEDGADLSRWFYNHPGTAHWPPDLGYWVGYRIVKTYYLRAHDKRAAFRTILEVSDPHAFLVRSGWQPGIALR
jgi:Predicted Zn-dependent protease (DUF2268)